MWYHVAEPSSYLALTGAGIDGVVVKKKALLLPMQKVTKFSITPFDFSLSLQGLDVLSHVLLDRLYFTMRGSNSPRAGEPRMSTTTNVPSHHECLDCGQRFKTRRELKQHVYGYRQTRGAHGRHLVRCSACNAIFRSRDAFKAHFTQCLGTSGATSGTDFRRSSCNGSIVDGGGRKVGQHPFPKRRIDHIFLEKICHLAGQGAKIHRVPIPYGLYQQLTLPFVRYKAGAKDLGIGIDEEVELR